MREIKANKEIKNVKNEIIMGLGIRECLILGVTAVFVGFLFIKSSLPSMVMCYLTAPVIAAATLLVAARPGGMPAEKFMFAMLRSILINNRKYKYADRQKEEVVRNVTKRHRKEGLQGIENTENPSGQYTN